MNDHNPAARYERPVAELRTRAALSALALGAILLARVWDFGARAWSIRLIEAFGEADETSQAALSGGLELADTLVTAGAYASNGLLLLTAILFLRWVHRLIALTRALGAAYLSWKPSQGVWAFIIPIVSLFRPYQVLRDVQEGLAPEDVEPPPLRLDPDLQVDYRSATFVVPPLPKPLPSSFLALWWGTFVAMSVVSRIANFATKGTTSTVKSIITAYRIEMFESVVAIIAAVLAIRVVRSLTARLEERFRRIRHSTAESLAAQQIVIEDRVL